MKVFDLPFLLKEIDILADELSKLPPSMDRTALELRLAQMRQIVELRARAAVHETSIPTKG